MEQNEALSMVNWPEKSGEYKVVQLDLDGHPYLRVAKESYFTHGLILRELFEAQEIEYQKSKGEAVQKSQIGKVTGIRLTEWVKQKLM